MNEETPNMKLFVWDFQKGAMRFEAELPITNADKTIEQAVELLDRAMRTIRPYFHTLKITDNDIQVFNDDFEDKPSVALGLMDQVITPQGFQSRRKIYARVVFSVYIAIIRTGFFGKDIPHSNLNT